MLSHIAASYIYSQRHRNTDDTSNSTSYGTEWQSFNAFLNLSAKQIEQNKEKKSTHSRAGVNRGRDKIHNGAQYSARLRDANFKRSRYIDRFDPLDFRYSRIGDDISTSRSIDRTARAEPRRDGMKRDETRRSVVKARLTKWRDWWDGKSRRRGKFR